MVTDERILRWADDNKCKLRRREDRLHMFCPGGYSFSYEAPRKGVRKIQDVELSFPIPHLFVGAKLFEGAKIEAGQSEFESAFPECYSSGMSQVVGSQFGSLDFRCESLSPKRGLEILEFLRISAKVTPSFVTPAAREYDRRTGWRKDWR